MVENLISIIIPVYNSEKHIEQCVNSALNQTYKEIEIILVDDGSQDNSYAVCQDLAKRDSRVFVYHKENGGVASARNYGLMHAHGEYIGFMDNDDYIEPDMYETLYTELKKTDAFVAQIGVEDVDEEHIPLKCYLNQQKYVHIINAKQFRKSLMLQTGNMACWSKLFCCEVLKEYTFIDGRWNEDTLLLHRIFSDSKYNKLVSIDKIGYHYVHRKGSYSKNGFNQGYVDNLKNSLYFVDNETDPDLVICAKRLFFHQLIPYYLFATNAYKKDNSDEYRSYLSYVKDDKRSWETNPYLSRKEKVLLFGMMVFPDILHKTLELINYKGYFR